VPNVRYRMITGETATAGPSGAVALGFGDYADVEGGAGAVVGPSPGTPGAFAGAATEESEATRKYVTRPAPPLSSYRQTATIITVVGFLLFMMSSDAQKYAVFVLMLCCNGLVFCKYLSDWLLSKDDGTPEMREVADPIREGAQAFLQTQYSAIAQLAVVVAIIIFLSYQLRPSDLTGGVNGLSSFTLGALGAFSFCVGAACSAVAGYVSMMIAAQTNIRVTSAARRGYLEALAICFRGGAFSAILVLALCVMGVTILHASLHFFFAGDVALGGIGPGDVPMLTVGYGFGASFVALFMQLGGGIYTKGADVGADMVGKIEQGIPEDDPRNPAVIADLVGDMVGDCVGSSADIFESIAAEIIGAMILAGTLAHEANLTYPSAFVYFPIMVHAFDIIVSSIGIMSLGDGTPRSMLSFVAGAASGNDLDPLRIMKRGYLLSISFAAVVFLGLTRWMLYEPAAPGAWFSYYLCGLIGIATSYVFILSTQYNTDYQYEPVRSIAAASTTGHGTNIIAGVAVGMKSTAIPVLMVSFAVISAYTLGKNSGIGSGANAGLFGTAVATMGMLSSAGYILAMNNYGPIADNAGGIAEMSSQPEAIRDATDRLDAAGNVTKAITYVSQHHQHSHFKTRVQLSCVAICRKGYSIGSAALACFLLFGALMDEMSAFAGRPFRSGAFNYARCATCYYS
jgi:H(+)-translocating pyrophosphatase